VASNGDILNNGNKTNGNTATTGIGKASLTHKKIINMAIDNTFDDALSKAKGFRYQNPNEIKTPIKIRI
jgi:hypothetical protein